MKACPVLPCRPITALTLPVTSPVLVQVSAVTCAIKSRPSHLSSWSIIMGSTKLSLFALVSKYKQNAHVGRNSAAMKSIYQNNIASMSEYYAKKINNYLSGVVKEDA